MGVDLCLKVVTASTYRLRELFTELKGAFT
jgi:hypothetical protein